MRQCDIGNKREVRRIRNRQQSINLDKLDNLQSGPMDIKMGPF